MAACHSDRFYVTHISGDFCGHQSTCQVTAPSSSTSVGVRYLTTAVTTAFSRVLQTSPQSEF